MKTKQNRKQEKGIVHIQTTFNNTIVNICDSFGNTICWSSSGNSGLKGARKETSFAAQLAAKNAALKAINLGMKTVEVIVKGRGDGRETSIRALEETGLIILSIKDKTPVIHNGCRPPKKRRL